MIQKSTNIKFIVLTIVLLLFILLNLGLGSENIPIKSIIYGVFGIETINESWHYIIFDYRLPSVIAAILVGSGLSISGLLMQTLFRNPLAGPFVLGISSGASLGVALLILGTSFFGVGISSFLYSSFGVAIAASSGAFLVMLVIMIVAQKVRNTMSILIIGLMFASFTSAIISVLAYFSTAQELQQFQFWSFGSIRNLNWNELGLFFSIYFIGMISVIFIIKPLNALLLGEDYAKSLGVNLKFTKNITLLITALLTGVITAFSGPIAFIGLAVPHLAKMVFNTSNHKVLLPASFVIGAIVMLFSNIIAELPNSASTLPINAITSMIGAPVVIWLLMRKRRTY